MLNFYGPEKLLISQFRWEKELGAYEIINNNHIKLKKIITKKTFIQPLLTIIFLILYYRVSYNT